MSALLVVMLAISQPATEDASPQNWPGLPFTTDAQPDQVSDAVMVLSLGSAWTIGGGLMLPAALVGMLFSVAGALISAVVLSQAGQAEFALFSLVMILPSIVQTVVAGVILAAGIGLVLWGRQRMRAAWAHGQPAHVENRWERPARAEPPPRLAEPTGDAEVRRCVREHGWDEDVCAAHVERARAAGKAAAEHEMTDPVQAR